MAAREVVERVGIAEIEKRLGRDRTTINRRIKNGTFPAGHFIGTRRAWFIAEIIAWEQAEMARPASSRKFNLPGVTTGGAAR
jgi:predicted DNA-binding transcriptional regulator AlpA